MPAWTFILEGESCKGSSPLIRRLNLDNLKVIKMLGMLGMLDSYAWPFSPLCQLSLL